MLISELFAIDGSASSAVVVGEVTTLSHESVDDSVEVGLLVSVSLLVVSSTDGSEVLRSFWNMVGIELEDHLSDWLIVFGDLHEDLGV